MPSNTIDADLPAAAAAARRAKGLSQVAVADAMRAAGHPTWSTKTLGRFEGGLRSSTSLGEVLSLALVLGTTVADLVSHPALRSPDHADEAGEDRVRELEERNQRLRAANDALQRRVDALLEAQDAQFARAAAPARSPAAPQRTLRLPPRSRHPDQARV